MEHMVSIDWCPESGYTNAGPMSSKNTTIKYDVKGEKMKDPCDDCVFYKIWGDDEIGANRYCTHPLVFKTPAMCPSVMNYRIKNRLEKVGE